MKFTFESYQNLLAKIIENGYKIRSYQNFAECEKPCIIRHDIDMDLDKAVEFARQETQIVYNGETVKSTYFILVSSDFYNIFSKKNVENIQTIIKMGHTIGLHFDEVKYQEELENCKDKEERIIKIQQYVEKEAELLGTVSGRKITEVSMHRPSKAILLADIKFSGILNSYSKMFFENFKYVSDSRMHWNENIENIVKSGEYKALHILVHPFWYSNQEEDMSLKLVRFLNMSKNKVYGSLNDNFRNLEDVISKEQLKLE
ncbi:hypothetical protein [Extibacter muris]|uniref:hypothetical protein n=1 Tax=Extibacter muris TaxID=1796622 RepID=UPI001D096535|nr:hypothetical protein [Extibacter muris]MCB6203666.1 hypothetical protein [Extibacter muris]MCQ4665220.1 hypothetical protein [Extibacter muris]MCQ4694634.1 hypothetical protein [Extibacter muris]